MRTMDGLTTTAPEPGELEPDWDMSGSVAPPGAPAGPGASALAAPAGAAASALAAPPAVVAATPAHHLALPAPRALRFSGWLTPLAIVIAVIAAGVAAVMAVGGGSGGPRAIAQQINLHLSDLPGYEVASKDQGLGASILPTGLEHGALSNCAGLDRGPRPGEVDAGSPWFRLSAGLTGEAVLSSVSVEPSSGLTAGDLTLLRSPHALACFTQAVGLGSRIGAAAVPGASVLRPRVHTIAAPGRGADGSLGVRIAMPVDVRGVTLQVDMDWLAYRVGRDELSLFTFAIDHPFVRAAEQQLSTLMINRARALPH